MCPRFESRWYHTESRLSGDFLFAPLCRMPRPTLLQQLQSIDADRVVWVHEAQLDKGDLSRMRETLQAELVVPLHEMAVEGGEALKTLAQTEQFWEHWSALGVTRRSLILTHGGGALSDAAGFAAATLKRGIAVAHVPTTILGMVDAAWGGKTGINWGQGKNQIGTFHHPEFVHVDATWLKTLSARELRAGLAEMAKHELLGPASLSIPLEKVANLDPSKHLDTWTDWLVASSNVKQTFVQADPGDLGARQALNLGHTVAHALESWSMAQGTAWLHGEAVAVGLQFALFEMSNETLTVGSSAPLASMPAPATGFQRWLKQAIPMPTPLPENGETLWPWMMQDKKNQGEAVMDLAIRPSSQGLWLARWEKHAFEATWTKFVRSM